MGKWINIEVSEELHYSLRLIAAKSGNTLKSTVILCLEDMVRKQEEKERSGEK